MNVYIVKNHVRNVHFLTMSKMKESDSAENLYNIVMNNLCDISVLDGVNIARKLVFFGADGASVMQGNHNSLFVRLQASTAPYMIGIHFMGHRTNLAFKILSKERLVNKVDILVDDLHGMFCRSSKRVIEFKKIRWFDD